MTSQTATPQPGPQSGVGEDAQVRQQSRSPVDDLLNCAECVEQFFLFDLLTGIGRILELSGATPSQCRERGEGRPELCTNGVFDGQMPTPLSGAKALLSEHSDEGETGRLTSSTA
jgi:hypothetical protein